MRRRKREFVVAGQTFTMVPRAQALAKLFEHESASAREAVDRMERVILTCTAPDDQERIRAVLARGIPYLTLKAIAEWMVDMSVKAAGR